MELSRKGLELLHLLNVSLSLTEQSSTPAEEQVAGLLVWCGRGIQRSCVRSMGGITPFLLQLRLICSAGSVLASKGAGGRQRWRNAQVNPTLKISSVPGRLNLKMSPRPTSRLELGAPLMSEGANK